MLTEEKTRSNRMESGGAVILGLSPTGISVARSLAPRGLPVYGIDSRRWDAGHYSRWIHHDPRISYFPPGDKLIEGLIRFGREQSIKPVLFITADKYMDIVAQRRSDLEPYYVLTDSMRPELTSVLLDKSTFYHRCLDLGIDLPKTYFPENERDVIQAASDLRYPAIVKPTMGYKVRRSLKGAKLIEVATPEELVKCWCQLHEFGSPSVLQECIIGPEKNIAVAALYMNRNHECLSVFTARKSRQYPPMYGSASYAESCWIPEIADKSISLMRSLQYHGICGTEYKWDNRDSTWKMVEVNCRPVLWFALTRQAGVDVVWDAYCDLRSVPNSIAYNQQDNGATWQLFVRDIPSAIYSLRHGYVTFREFMQTLFRVRDKVEGVFSWEDWPGNWGYVVDTFARIYTQLGGRATE